MALKKKTPKENTKRKLIAAAKLVFAEKGFEGASVQDLAKAAGVNVSLVSYYFDGKEGLYRTCLEEFGNSRHAVADRILAEPESLEDFKVRLRLWVGEIVASHVDEAAITSILHRECNANHAVTQKIFHDVFIKLFGKLVHFFKSSQKKEYLKQDLDPHMTALLIWGSIINTCRIDHMNKEFFNQSIQNVNYRKKLIEHVIALSFFGILKDSER